VGGRQLTITRANGQTTRTGVTVQVGLRSGGSVKSVAQGQSIQTAIDAAGTNDLILVQPGLYSEMVVMWKPVQLQGWGAGSTTIDAIKAPTEKLQTWRLLVDNLITSGAIDLLPGQGVGFGAPEPTQLFTEEGAGVLVLAKQFGASSFNYQSTGRRVGGIDNQGARIDGFTIRSADTGGGIVANGYADNLSISNNRISNNSGFFGGGIRSGHPELVSGDDYTDSDNDYVSIHHNQIVFNGGLGGAGAGISMCTGSDSYQITENWVCGNFSLRDGGGIGHVGLSDRASFSADVPLIADNKIIFNESFFQGQTVSGGGVFISGAAPLTIGGLSPGAGNVQVISNYIQGNSAGAGDGGGIRLARINGWDVTFAPTDSADWYTIDIMNNMIVNNSSALAGGGISMQDAAKVNLVHNTIANNDSLATAGEAFAPGSPNRSTPQPGAGITSRAHSADLAAAGNVGTFSDPNTFTDNIIWQNRQFFFYIAEGIPGDPQAPSVLGLCPDLGGTITGLNCPGGNDQVFDDLAVIGTPGVLSGTTNLVTPGGWTSPVFPAVSELFVSEYFNGSTSSVLQQEITTVIEVPPALDEGGNFIRPKFGPLTLYDDATPNNGDPGTLFGDYHILLAATDAVNSGSSPTPPTDIDEDSRTASPDIGADEAN